MDYAIRVDLKFRRGGQTLKETFDVILENGQLCIVSNEGRICCNSASNCIQKAKDIISSIDLVLSFALYFALGYQKNGHHIESEGKLVYEGQASKEFLLDKFEDLYNYVLSMIMREGLKQFMASPSLEEKKVSYKQEIDKELPSKMGCPCREKKLVLKRTT